MKKHLRLQTNLLVLLCGCLLFGCFYEDDSTPPFARPAIHPSPYYEAQYADREEFESHIGSESPRQITNLGKIWRFNDLLLVNERYEGVHVIDNTNPSAPIFKSFIAIPGNVDMAVRGNRLFADSGPDLVSIDISDTDNIRVVDRIRNVYEDTGVFDPYGYWHSLTNGDQVFTGFNKKQ